MRKVGIFCDKCGAEIKGNPVSLIMEIADRDNPEIIADDWRKSMEICMCCMDNIINGK